ncbi:MAG: ComEC/Rec2 family competence protein [Firmicutes bacterium]|nr:ComEC/Rec2 family competence protein [Bacillota bacterium]
MRTPLLWVAVAFASGIFLDEVTRPGLDALACMLVLMLFILAVCLHLSGRIFDRHYGSYDLLLVVVLAILVALSGALRREVQVCFQARAPGQIVNKVASQVVGRAVTGHPAAAGHSAGIALRLKEAILDIHGASLSPRHAALLSGFLFGERGMDREVEENLRACGVVHLLSASGLHVGFVAMLLSGLMAAAGLPRGISAAVTIAGVLVYAAMAGMRAPVMRAGIMFTAAALARCMQRDVDGRNLLGLAGLALLAWDPSLVFDMGFQLSFMATFGILEFAPCLAPRLVAFASILIGFIKISTGAADRAHPRRSGRPGDPGIPGWPGTAGSWLAETVAVTVAAQAGVLPLIAYYFNEVSLIGLVTNPIMVPLAEAAVIIGLVSGLTGLALPAVAEVFNAANAVILEAIITGARVFARLPFASVPLPCPNLAVMFLYYCLSYLVFCSLVPPGSPLPFKAGYLKLKRIARRAGEWWRWRGPGDKLIIGMTLATVLVALLALRPGAPLRVTFIAVGQGDAELIQTPSGRAILLDGGSSYGRMGAVTATLRRRGVRRLDAVIISHPHEDHIGGLKDIISKKRVGRVIDVGLEHPSPVYEELLGLIKNRRIPYLVARRGLAIKLDRDVRLDVLHPGPLLAGTRDDINNNSLVVRLSYRNIRFLFTGDIELEAQRTLVAKYRGMGMGGGGGGAVSEGPGSAVELRSTVLKVPHHGSRYSVNDLFFRCVDPEVAIVSVGRNRFGHPDAGVLELLASGGSTVYRTDECGSITVVTDGRGIRVVTGRNRARR